MKDWVLFATISMVFAGITSIVAKLGLSGISGETGVFVRTIFVAIFVCVFALWAVPFQELRTLSFNNLGWLGVSALCTTASWIFFYKAIARGEVSVVTLIDKGSVIVALILSVLILKENFSIEKALGSVLIVSGILVLIRA